MLRLLVITPEGAGPTRLLADALSGTEGATRYQVYSLVPDGLPHRLQDSLYQAFDGRPPDALLCDLSTAGDALPLVHLLRAMQQVWEGLPPLPCLALLSPIHLNRTEWMAQVDDFLLPPYSAAEARTRLDLLLFRRRYREGQSLMAFADLRLDLDTSRAQSSDGTYLSLTPREFDLLRFLITHQGKLFSRERLLDFVWGVDYSGGERTVDIHIRRLRTKLPPLAAQRLETQRGVGYGFLM